MLTPTQRNRLYIRFQQEWKKLTFEQRIECLKLARQNGKHECNSDEYISYLYSESCRIQNKKPIDDKVHFLKLLSFCPANEKYIQEVLYDDIPEPLRRNWIKKSKCNIAKWSAFARIWAKEQIKSIQKYH